MIHTIDAQIERMGALWPALEVVSRDGSIAMWRGPVRPLLQSYEIGIAYRAPMLIEKLDVRTLQPRVSVRRPALRPRPGDPEGRLPHVYYDSQDRPLLCLLDPDANDWSPALFLAETTVPWTIEWLAAYEGWRATGMWTASGRHIEMPNV